MRNIRKALDNLFPKINSIQESPTVTILRVEGAATGSTNPFEVETEQQFDKKYENIPCLYNMSSEIVTSNNNLMTQEIFWFYIKIEAAPGGFAKFSDRFIFQGRRYRPVEISDIFSYILVKATRE
jgi:hypothetical protein